MDPAPFLETMAQEVAQRRAHLKESSDQEIARVHREARDRAETRRLQTQQALERELRDLAQRARERAEAEAQMVLLTTKDTITEELLSSVRDELARIAAGPQFPAILEQLLEELVENAPEGDVVLAPPEHLDRCRTWLAKHDRAHLRVQGDPALYDGVAIQDARHKFRVTNTLSARFERRKESLRKYCIRELFGDAPTRSTGEGN